MSLFSRRRNSRNDNRFLRNGAILLEKLITSGIGKPNQIRSFSVEDLKLATNNYDEQKIIGVCSDYKLYKGFLQNRPTIIMKYIGNVSSRLEKLSYNNIVFTSQVCHKNVLKLIGCCLETEVPFLAYEFVEYVTLDHYIDNDSSYQLYLEPLLLRHRLKIAMQIANAMAYLHFGFSRPIVFKELKPSNILLDAQNVVKLLDFSQSESIPKGQTYIKQDNVAGVHRFMAPEYALGEFNEKSDVYSFCVLLLELLTGRRIGDLINLALENVEEDDCAKADYIDEAECSMSGHIEEQYCRAPDYLSHYLNKHVDNNTYNEIVDPVIVGEASYPEMQQQLRDVIQLISKGVIISAEDRPTMIDVAKQLRQIYLTIV